MNEKIYDNQAMIAYLLGSLPEAEAVRVDELSFTDDEFAEDLKIAENDLIDAYINGELQNPTLEKFESYYLASPVRREKVKFAQAFQIFAEKNSAAQTAGIVQETSDDNKTKRTFAGFFSDFNIFAAPRPALQWSFAAAVLLFTALGGWLIFLNSRPVNQIGETDSPRVETQKGEKQLQNEITEQQKREADLEKEQESASLREESARLEEEKKQKLQDEQAQERKRLAEQNRKRIEEREIAAAPKPLPKPRRLNIASFILAPSLRGNNQLQTLSISPGTDVTAMQLKLETDDFAFYRVRLQNQSDGKILWQSGKIKSKAHNKQKVLDVRFPAEFLQSKIYSLEVSGVRADGAAEIISNYSFRIVR